MNAQQMKCEYCGAVRDRVMFCIGASKEPDWTMHEGTGKIACPDCHEKGVSEGQAAVKRHCESLGYKDS